MTEDYFTDVEKQILDKKSWESDNFVVFTHEAGSGKSQETFRFLAQLPDSIKVLCVQRFTRNGDLLKTVDTINKHAGRNVATHFDSHSPNSSTHFDKIKQHQILVISHQMLAQIYKGSRRELIDGRNVQIIDEFPEFLLEPLSITMEDFSVLWSRSKPGDQLERVVIKLKNVFHEYDKLHTDKRREFINTIPFGDEKYEDIRSVIEEELKNCLPNDKAFSNTLRKISYILMNPCYYYEYAIHSYYPQNHIPLLKNNIILDANSFEHRYKLNTDLFDVCEKEPFYDYKNSTITHFKIDTSKSALKKNKDIAETLFRKIEIEKLGKVLIVSDKDNKQKIEEALEKHFTLRSPNENWTENVAIDHFGNLIGSNEYRDFDSIIILKTPFHPFNSYVTKYLFFSKDKDNKTDEQYSFNHPQIEKLRISIICGEFYQAIKRINRNNEKSSKIFICSLANEAIDLMLTKFPNIKYHKEQLPCKPLPPTLKVEPKKSSYQELSLKLIEELQYECSKQEDFRIKKSEFAMRIGLKDQSNFSKVSRPVMQDIKSLGIQMNKHFFVYQP